MIAYLPAIIIVISAFSIFTSPFLNVFASESNSTIESETNQFADNLKSMIQNLIAGAINDSSSLLNSSSSVFLNNTSKLSSILNNDSNFSSNQVIVSNNRVMSSIINNGTGSNSLIKDTVKTMNGVCNSVKVAGNGNDTLFSNGNCNDELTGGPGADKFSCGEGNDTIKDYNPKEGDVILDQKNCENIQ